MAQHLNHTTGNFDFDSTVREAVDMVKNRDSFARHSIKDPLWKFNKFLNRILHGKIGDFVFKNKAILKTTTQQYNLIYEEWKKIRAIETIYHFIANPDKFKEVYGLLADDHSRAIFEWLIKYRIAYAIRGYLANTFYPVPRPAATGIPAAGTPANASVTVRRSGDYFKINDYYIDSLWCELENTWITETYRLEGICEPEPGDVIIDVGSLYGETAIWFADKAGSEGKVYTFEPSIKNCAILRKNLRKNRLENIITIVETGLWDQNTTIFINQDGPGTVCNEKEGPEKLEVITLDSFFETHDLNRLDFVKMDIEGAEFKALQGAARTIARFKPKLAICVYHLPDDIINLPLYIKSLVPEYKIYLSHKIQDWVETILFATVE